MHENDLQRELGQNLVEEVNKGRMTRRELLVRGTVIGLSMSTIGSLLAACGGSTTASSSASASASVAPKTGGTMRVAMVPPTGALDPVVMYDAGAIATVQQVCEYLAWAENDLSLRPVLAESWTPDAAAKTWTFKLRQNVTFNNGQAMTADDVVATFQRLTRSQVRLVRALQLRRHPLDVRGQQGRREHRPVRPRQRIRRTSRTWSRRATTTA